MILLVFPHWPHICLGYQATNSLRTYVFNQIHMGNIKGFQKPYSLILEFPKLNGLESFPLLSMTI